MDPNPALLDVKLLRLLDQLYTTRSVTRAAEALGQSQPTVSIWLARLRAQLGDPLFVRTGEGMLPTPRTDGLIGTVREVLAGLQRLTESTQGFEPATAQRRFCHLHDRRQPHHAAAAAAGHMCGAVAPGVSLEASRIDGHLAQALQAGEADLAVGFLPWLDAGFYQQTLYAQDWICLANAHHPRVVDDSPTHWNLAVYQAEAHIGISSGTGYQLMDSAVASQHLTRQIRLEPAGFSGACQRFCPPAT